MAFTAKIADLIADDKTGLLAKHESWGRVPLSEVATILNGAPFDSAKFSTSNGVPLARIRDVLAGETSTYYTGEYDDAYLLSQGDLLIGMDGDFNIGYWSAQPALLNQRVCKLTSNSEFYDKALLGYVLPGYLAAINANTPSITVKHLSSKTVGEIELPLPPRVEQVRIVEKLEELLSDLDAGVAELKAAQRKLAQYRQSLLKAAVQGALTADWRAARGKPRETGAELLQRILSERRARWEQKQLAKFAEQGKAPPNGWQAKYSEPASEMNDLPPLPDGWVWAGFDQVFDPLSDGGKKLPQAEYAQSGRFPVVDQGAKFVGGYTDDASLLFDGHLPAIVFGDHTRRFKMVQTPFVVGADGAKLIGLSQAWNPNFAFMACEALEFEDRGYSRHFQFVRNSAFPLPPLDEQNQVVERFTSQLDSQRELVSAVDASLRQAAAQRKNLLKAAFAGQLVPQNPDDEPASELLARIRAKRANKDGSAPRRRRKTA